jgi:hypothetical protein
MKVRGQDLKGGSLDADYFDVRTIAGSTLVRDPMKQREMVNAMIQLGVLDPAQHRDVILKILDVADIETAFEDDRLDEQWADRENELMEGGAFPQPRDFENHQIHTKVVNRFRKSERYRRLPPKIQALFDNHAALLTVQAIQKTGLLSGMIEGAGQMGAQGGEEGEETEETGEEVSRSEG